MKKPDTEELARRIALDFNKTREEIIRELEIYYPEITDEMIAGWEQSGALEYETVDGQKRYFRNAAKNLMRLDRDARELREQKEGRERAGRAYVLSQHIPAVIKAVRSQLRGSSRLISGLPVSPIIGEFEERIIPDEEYISPMEYMALPHRWRFYSRITVRPDAVPAGEEILCWMPMPRADIHRQVLEDSNELLAKSIHAAHFMCKSAEASRPTVFWNSVPFKTAAEFHPLPKGFEHQPVDTQAENLLPHLMEQAPHIVFTDSLKELAFRTVGRERRPYYMARAIFDLISKHYPWISAREYSTIDCIPEYVVRRGGGDCGQVTMLFITLCRILGIPARWQSGFSLIPGYENFHDWADIYIPGLGWIPVDPSFGIQRWGKTEEQRYFYFGGIDAFRMIVNKGWGGELWPKKRFSRSEPVDFQRGEVEWKEGNLYFDTWDFSFWVEPQL
ncbi:MAG: transglutaminase domain-containing protein [bacterium]|uniref:Transglutaminase domain-containing protein n=1 Tax=Candidatus Aphodosoma intestinipullorum TaxID=2840674 RepID=A0A940IEM9_9BACT|nr:transglutaminase domain-containing protein [Candidatus Aphodosoma intestinipullorum]